MFLLVLLFYWSGVFIGLLKYLNYGLSLYNYGMATLNFNRYISTDVCDLPVARQRLKGRKVLR